MQSKVHVAFAAVVGSQQDILLTVFTPPQVCISRGDQRIRATCALGFMTTAAKHLWLDANAHIIHSNNECSKSAVDTACGLPYIGRSVYKVKHSRGGRRVLRRTKAARKSALSAACGGVQKKSSPRTPRSPCRSAQKVLECLITTGPTPTPAELRPRAPQQNSSTPTRLLTNSCEEGTPGGGASPDDETAAMDFFAELEEETDFANEDLSGHTLTHSASTASNTHSQELHACEAPVGTPSNACAELNEHALHELGESDAGSSKMHGSPDPCMLTAATPVATAIASRMAPKGVAAQVGQLQSECVAEPQCHEALGSQKLDSTSTPTGCDANTANTNNCEAISPIAKHHSVPGDSLKALHDTDSGSKESCDACMPAVLSKAAEGQLCNRLNQLNTLFEHAASPQFEAPMVPPGRPHRFFFPEMPRQHEDRKRSQKRQVCTRSSSGVRALPKSVYALTTCTRTSVLAAYEDSCDTSLHRRCARSMKPSPLIRNNDNELQYPYGAHNLTAQLHSTSKPVPVPRSLGPTSLGESAPHESMCSPHASTIPLPPNLTRSPSEPGPTRAPAATGSHSWPQAATPPGNAACADTAIAPLKRQRLHELDAGSAAVPSSTEALKSTAQMLKRGSLKPAMASLPTAKMQCLAQQEFVALRTAFSEPSGSSQDHHEMCTGLNHPLATLGGENAPFLSSASVTNV